MSRHVKLGFVVARRSAVVAAAAVRARAVAAPQHPLHLRHVGVDAPQRHRRRHGALQRHRLELPHLQPQEGAARRARAGGHRRGELRPHALPRAREPRPDAGLPERPLRNDQTTALPVGCTQNCGGNCECGCRMPTHTTETTYGAVVRQRLPQRARGRRHEAPRRPQARRGRLRSDRTATSATVYRWIDGTEDAGDTVDDASPTPSCARTRTGTRPSAARCSTRACTSTTSSSRADPEGRLPHEHHHLRDRRRRDLRHGKAGNATLNPTTCAQTGYATFHPEVQACQLNVNSGVKTYVLTDVEHERRQRRSSRRRAARTPPSA